LKNLLTYTFFALLLLGCTDTERDNPNDPRAVNYNGVVSSSPSVEIKNYCVYAETQQCYFGLYSECPGVGGRLADFCPYGSSSSVGGYSSSFGVGGSSSSQDGRSSSSSSSNNSNLATYIVTYNAGTDVAGVAVPVDQIKKHGITLTLSTGIPTRTGYTFIDWNTAPDGKGMSYASGANYQDNANVTLYAQWKVNTYTVTYSANSGSGTPTAQTKTHDVALTLSSTQPTRTGYIFAGWNTEAYGEGTAYASGASYTNNASVTLYAQWTAIYSVTYNANNGIGAPEAQTKKHDVALMLSMTVPTRTGYAFAGWNTVAGGGGTSYAAGASYTANASVTLYAQWNWIIVYGTPVTYEGETYQTVVIGTQTWFQRNLNYAATDSKCNYNQESYCNTYGRLYNWATAMNLQSGCNSTTCGSQIDAKHKGICPSGWHIPSHTDWDKLVHYVDDSTNGKSSSYGSSTAGFYLKSKNGWDDFHTGIDTFGFSALPGDEGQYGKWWSTTEYICIGSCMKYSSDFSYGYDEGVKYGLFYVRCLQD